MKLQNSEMFSRGSQQCFRRLRHAECFIWRHKERFWCFWRLGAYRKQEVRIKKKGGIRDERRGEGTVKKDYLEASKYVCSVSYEHSFAEWVQRFSLYKTVTLSGSRDEIPDCISKSTSEVFTGICSFFNPLGPTFDALLLLVSSGNLVGWRFAQDWSSDWSFCFMNEN